MAFRIINGKINYFEDYSSVSTSTKKESTKKADFKDVLKTQIDKKNGFVISNHAAQRLKQRNINFNDVDMKTINDGINKANEKGAKDCLILYKDTALITSIKNRTIVTAMDKESSKGNVFTNLDSVVII
jgi:flagellar operon protein